MSHHGARTAFEKMNKYIIDENLKKDKKKKL